jgi:hypothetical protein
VLRCIPGVAPCDCNFGVFNITKISCLPLVRLTIPQSHEFAETFVDSYVPKTYMYG